MKRTCAVLGLCVLASAACADELAVTSTTTPVGDIEAAAAADIARNQRFMLDRMDLDGDGRVTREEFVDRAKPKQIPAREKVFPAWDRDGDGIITREECTAPDAQAVRGHVANLQGLGAPGRQFVYKHSAGRPREIEVFLPPTHDPAKHKVPGVLLFHGGGWHLGDMADLRPLCNYLASRGLVAATANYRMMTPRESRSPEGDKRVCIIDAKTAIRWFKQHAAKFGFDPDRLVVGGGSAGGHIALLATTNPGLDDPDDPEELRAIDTGVVAYLLQNPAFQEGDRKDPEVDVLVHARKGMAPAWVTFGTEDNWKAGWDTVHPRLVAVGQKIEYWLAEGQGHSFFNKNPAWGLASWISADRFLVKLGLLTGDCPLAAPASGEQFVAAPAPAVKKE